MVGLPDKCRQRKQGASCDRHKKFRTRVSEQAYHDQSSSADVKKEGSSYDLPIAVGMLASSGQVREDLLKKYIILGELALDGSLRPVHGVLPISVEIKKKGFRGIILPKENAREAAMVEGLDVFGVENLSETISLLNDELSMTPLKINIDEIFA